VRGAEQAVSATNGVSASQADHADILDQLSEYLDGSLSPAEAERVQQHLDGCERCQAFWRTLQKVVTATHQLSAPGMSESAKRRLVDDTLSVPS
jgi:anti-sigma factor RsiW